MHCINNHKSNQDTHWVSLKMPLTCGEWVQGRLGGEDFLVSCPIDIFTSITLSCQKIEGEDNRIKALRQEEDGEWSYPEKAVKALENASFNMGLRGYFFELEINCPKPLEKGFATSSADVFGSIMALKKLFNLELSAEKFFKLGVEIEPSDSIGFPGLWKINHRGVKLKENKKFSPAPIYLGGEVEGKVIVIDFGGKIETTSFNNDEGLNHLYEETSRESMQAYKYIRKGIKQKNLALMARGATLSALSHQRILPKRELGTVVESLGKIKALGLVVAHSGTLMGIIYPSHKTDFNEFYKWHHDMGRGKVLGEFNLRGGGVEWTGGGVIEAS